MAAYATYFRAKMGDTTLTVRQIEARSAYDRQVKLTLPFAFSDHLQAKFELEIH